MEREKEVVNKEFGLDQKGVIDIDASPNKIDTSQQNILAYNGIGHDNTENLMKEIYYKMLFDFNPIGITTADSESIIKANDAFLKIIGYSREDLNEGRIYWRKITPHEYLNLDDNGIRELIENGHYTPFEKEYIRKDGKRVSVIIGASLIKRNPIQWVCFVEDITEHKAIERKLKETGEYLESLLNYANSPIVVWNDHFVITKFNNAFEDLTGHSKNDVIGKKLNTLFSFVFKKNEEIMKSIKRTMSGERLESVEIPIVSLDGSERIVLWNSANIYDYNGKITSTIAQGQDITERKRAEIEVAKSLKEKELLLEEVNHRVKNNLQLISSLLHLQESKVNGETASILLDSRNRIKSIALVHQILYQSKDFLHIDVNNFLRKLAQSTLETYNSKNVLIDFDIEEIPLEINMAIPCGLIVNELITNALKHAFIKKAGKIILSLKLKDNKIELTVKDDGIGIPDNFILEEKSLGLKLVKSLTNQLEGNLCYVKGNGTTFKITFPFR